jgi:hypothetical protein
MRSIEPRPGGPEDILTRQRIGAAIGALADPNRGPTDHSLRLDDGERHSIRRTLRRSTHPLVAFPVSLLDQWDELADDDRVAGLLLFAELVNGPERDRRLSSGRATGRGVER